MFLKVCTCICNKPKALTFENIKRSHSDCEHGNLAHDQIQNAKLIWIRENQNVLRHEKKYSELVNSLNLFEEKDGISRSKGRITNSHLPYKTRSLILMSKNPNFQNCPSLNATAEFRSNYLLTQGKSFVKKILFDCVTCKHYDTRPYNYPKPPDLPKERVSCETPFSNSEVDYLGPVYCKNIYDANSSDDGDRHKAFYAVVVFFGSPNMGSVENY